MWYDKVNPYTVFMDQYPREIELTDRTFICKPDIIADFRNIPYDDNTFKLVVFDPPHLIRAGDKSFLKSKYGKLPKNWGEYLKCGFEECMRVLDYYGVLIFKWSDVQINASEVLNVIGNNPLFGDRRGKTRWMVFMKNEALDYIEEESDE